jgi:hypothetical protein
MNRVVYQEKGPNIDEIIKLRKSQTGFQSPSTTFRTSSNKNLLSTLS